MLEIALAVCVSIPKGEAINKQDKLTIKWSRTVSISKGEATNTLKSLILLYQLYAHLSMFLYQNICGKLISAKKNQAIKPYQPFPSIQLLPEIKAKPRTSNLKPYTNQTSKFSYLRSTDLTFGQIVDFIQFCCINSQNQNSLCSFSCICFYPAEKTKKEASLNQKSQLPFSQKSLF